eukprot:965215-Prymnesium_polylepis.1
MGDLDGMFRRFFTAIATMIAALSTMLSQGHSEGLGDEWAWYLLGVSALLQGSTTLFASPAHAGNSNPSTATKGAALAPSNVSADRDAVCADHMGPPLLGLSVRARHRAFPSRLICLRVRCSACSYFIYPRAGEGELYEVETFNRWDRSLKAMFDHMVVGKRFSIELDNISQLTTIQHFGMFVYLLVYLVCLMLVLQLMYRFLNATLTSKFNAIQRESTLQWRINVARQILRFEFIWQFIYGTNSTRAGDANENWQFLQLDKKLSPSDDDQKPVESVYTLVVEEVSRSVSPVSHRRQPNKDGNEAGERSGKYTLYR